MFKPENIQGLLEPEIILLIFIKNTSFHFLYFAIIVFIQNYSGLVGIFKGNNPYYLILSLIL